MSLLLKMSSLKYYESSIDIPGLVRKAIRLGNARTETKTNEQVNKKKTILQH